MRVFLLFLISICFTLNSVAQNPFVGDWEGTIGAIRLILHINETDGKLTATLDSPDQGAKGIKCDEVRTTKDSITVTLKAANASYEGLLTTNKNTLEGNWKQGGQTIPLNLKKGSGTYIELVKPQTPKPPFPYTVEEVEYDNKDRSVHFGATLTKPNGNGPFPAVIIISGSGTQDRDGSMFGHKSYAVLADHLTRNGIAVLRVDDRGIGKTTLGTDFKKLTSADFAKDVETGIAYLQSRSDISKKKIGLVGHSEGGMIAPMVAATNNDVAFIVLLAGPGQKGADIWNYQMQRAFERPGLMGKDKQLADNLVNTVFEVYQSVDDTAAIQQGIKRAYDRWKKNVPDSTEKRLLISPGPDAFLKFSNSLNNGLSWIRYFLNYDPKVNLSKLKIPVLAVNGEEDIQITANENLTAIEAALKKGGNKRYTIKAFPHLNHLFQTTPAKEQAYGSIEETFSPGALNFISQWIVQQVQK